MKCTSKENLIFKKQLRTSGNWKNNSEKNKWRPPEYTQNKIDKEKKKLNAFVKEKKNFKGNKENLKKNSEMKKMRL